MSDRSSWTQVRVSNMREDVRKGLEARIADPLWSLLRQWQFGAFRGDDAASPAKIKVSHVSLRTSELLVRGRTIPLEDTSLLEAIVEADDAAISPAAPRMAGEAGLEFLRLLPEKARKEAQGALARAYPLKIRDLGDGRTARVLRHLARGSFDGTQLRREIEDQSEALAEELRLDPREFGKIAKRWVQYYDGRFEPELGNSWQQNRLEHRAKVRAVHGAKTKIDLTADGYPGGRLDWQDFRITRTRNNAGTMPKPTTQWLLPSPVSYAGMPADRFWDFEDGAVYFGGLGLDEENLAQIVLTEFATVYSNDWFMVPVEVPTGSITRITRIEVHDVFGDVVEVEPCAVKDDGARPWRFFELENDPSVRQKLAPWLFIPRGVIGGEVSTPVEQVLFTRDEAANMAWGIETLTETGAGFPRDRAQHWNRVKDKYASYTGVRKDEPELPEEAWRYRLVSTAPPHWVPFAPTVVDDLPTGQLQRSRLSEWDLLGEARKTLAGPQGRIMDPSAPMLLEEEEIQRGGVRVVRHYQSARGPDGKLRLWLSHAKTPAGGDRSSGRRTDWIETDERGGGV